MIITYDHLHGFNNVQLNNLLTWWLKKFKNHNYKSILFFSKLSVPHA